MRANAKTLIVLSLLVLFSASGFLIPENLSNVISDEEANDFIPDSSVPTIQNDEYQKILSAIPSSTSGSGSLLHVKEYATRGY